MSVSFSMSLFSTSPSSSIKVVSFGYGEISGEIATRESIVSAITPATINVICYVYPKLFNANQYIVNVNTALSSTVNKTLLMPTICKLYAMYYHILGDFANETKYDDYCIKYIKLMNESSMFLKPSNFTSAGKVKPYEI